MGLYRNIAGIEGPGSSVGFTFLDRAREYVQAQLDTQTTQAPTTTNDVSTPVEMDSSGGVHWLINDLENISEAPTPGAQTALPTTVPGESPTSTTPLPTDTKTALTNNILPLAALAGLVYLAASGDNVLPRKKKVVFVVGLGALYYAVAKKQTT